MLRRQKANLTVLAGYCAISFLYFGWRLLPHPGRLLIGGYNTRDPEFFIWSFTWWPHALAHLLNPLSTSVIYAPTGVNLTWTATSPGLAVVFMPVTVLFGPGVAYNLAAMLMPALSAWTAYLLCRSLTRSVWAAVIGGYVFGFSSEVLMEVLWGNLDISGVFLLPLIALVIVRHLRGELPGRGLAWRLGLLLAAQIWVSTEHVFTATFMLIVCFAFAAWLLPELRPRLRAALAPIGAGYAFGGLLASPFVVYAVLGLPSGRFGPATPGSDLLSFIVPPPIAAIGGSSLTSVSHHFFGTGAYLGLPLLAIICTYVLRGRRTPLVRYLLALFLFSALIAIGSHLYIEGQEAFSTPVAACRLPARIRGRVPIPACGLRLPQRGGNCRALDRINTRPDLCAALRAAGARRRGARPGGMAVDVSN